MTLSQSVEALDLALREDDTFADRLALEAAEAENHALARRLGFLVARLAGSEAARPFLLLIGDSNAITPLQRGAATRGPIDSKWRVRENAPFERLVAHREVM